MAFTINPVTTPADIADTIQLFKAYTQWLNIDLTFQDFTTELASLPGGKYAPPNGIILLARLSSGEALGCVALRPMSAPGICEMKRLYVTPGGRGLGLGRALLDRVLAEARRIGYRSVRLDTLPAMQAAIDLYTKAGFLPIPPYYETPLEGTVFLEMVLEP